MSQSFSDPEREKLSGEITALQALEHCDRRVPTSQLIRSYRTWTGAGNSPVPFYYGSVRFWTVG